MISLSFVVFLLPVACPLAAIELTKDINSDDFIKERHGIEYLKNGEKYVGEFAQGRYNGRGVYTYRDGSFYDGFFLNGKRDGPGLLNFSNGDSFLGEFKEDFKEGKGYYRYKSGDVERCEGVYKNDKRHGKFLCYYFTGTIAEHTYKNGIVVTTRLIGCSSFG